MLFWKMIDNKIFQQFLRVELDNSEVLIFDSQWVSVAKLFSVCFFFFVFLVMLSTIEWGLGFCFCFFFKHGTLHEECNWFGFAMQVFQLTHMFFPHCYLAFLPFLVMTFRVFCWEIIFQDCFGFSLSLTFMLLLTCNFKESHIKCISK